LAWHGACEQANDWDRTSTARLSQMTKDEKKRIKELERDLARKDRALAETAARLVLRKKASAIWGGGDEAHDQPSASPNRHRSDRRGRHLWCAPRASLCRTGDQ